MDTLRIVKQEGYRYEDLPDEHKTTIDGMHYLKDHYGSPDTVKDLMGIEGETIIDKARSEVVDEAIEIIDTLMEITIAEMQIYLAEKDYERLPG